MYFWGDEKTKKFLLGVVDLCCELKIDAVAGQILSGSVMATSIITLAMTRDMEIRGIFLKKSGGLYVPAKHGSETKEIFCYANDVKRVMIVDDIVITGDSMISSAEEILSHKSFRNIVAFVSGGGWPNGSLKRVVEKHPKSLFFGYGFNYKLLEYTKEEFHGPLDS